MTDIANFKEQLKRLGDPLPIEAVEFRIQSISEKGWATLLAYKNARVDMDRLDASIGRGFWQRKHERIDGREYCHVSIWNPELKQWVSVSDVGTPSNVDAVKGEASDAFKRACVNFGCGRELYELPLILVQLNDNEFFVKDEKGKKRGQATYDLHLSDWIWHCERSLTDENGKTQLLKLFAVDDRGRERYRYPRGSTGQSSQNTQTGQSSTSVPHGTSADTATQSSSGGQQADKPWFNEFEDQKAWFIEQFRKGFKSDIIIAKLKETKRLSKETEKKIRDLAVATTAAASGADFPNEECPF